MRRPRSLLSALVVAATTAILLPVPAAGAVRSQAAPAPEDDDPLQVSIARLEPGEIPDRGPVRMRGTVTNVSDERWRSINVHAFVGDTPLTSAAELAAAAEVPPDTEVGNRIFIPGTFDSIGGLDPGESAPYEVVLRRSQIPADDPGVYWFGAHALGNTSEARDAVADGRARTFLPLVPRNASPVETSLVVPLRHPVSHTRSGRLLGEAGWARTLSPGGALHDLLGFGAAAGDRPLTWLVDPAVPDTVRRLVEGNGPRSLAEDPEPGTAGPDASSSPEPSGGESESASPSPDAEPEPGPGVAAEPGREWLTRLGEVIGGERVLSLPYGDLDVSAAHDHGPTFLSTAQLRLGDELDRLEVTPLPAVVPTSGYLSVDALAALPEDTRAVLSDRMLPDGAGAAPYDVDGRPVLFAATDVGEGGPGPDDPLGTVAVRQRLLAEAAVRGLDRPRSPLLVVLPPTWTPDRPRSFWRGLGVPWLSLTDPTSLVASRRLAADRLEYPAAQRAAEVPAANFTTAVRLEQAGQLLANVLTANDTIGREVTDEVLTSLSYSSRSRAEQVRQRAEQSVTWIERRTRGVRVRAPRGVTLSSQRGGFGTTITNRLDHPVTVSLKAITDAGLTVDAPAALALGARSSQTIELQAQATRPGVHYVRLVVTDDTGAPLGSSARLPVRAAQVSEVIWLILGVGVGMLFLAIAVRLVRRIRSDGG